jgi:uncharacterized membrane protein
MTETRQEADAPPGVDFVAANVETIATLHAAAERTVPRHQRAIETITGHLGRPISLYLMIAFVALWIGANIFGQASHHKQFDPPPFSLLQFILSFSALLVSTMVLITQNRQAHLAERRSHLDIQVNLIAEQKIAKLIALVEELRNDLPNVKNRVDPEAQAMTQSADPHIVAEEIRKQFDNVDILPDETDQEGRPPAAGGGI